MTRLDLTYANKNLDPKLITVHSGNFHADDVFAAMLLRAVYPAARIIRSRDIEEINKCDIVIDVGLIYDPESLRFDHHQDGKAGKRENGIEYSGFGLVWKYWGMEICRGDKDLYDDIDRIIVQPIDAQDNGQPLYRQPVYEGVTDLNLDGILKKAFNPHIHNEEIAHKKFLESLDFAEDIFSRLLDNRRAVLDEKKDILKDYNELDDKRFIIDEDHRPVLAFVNYMPELLFYIFPATNINGWILKTAQEAEFKNRKDLPKEWAGKSGVELERISGVKDILFCHNNLFICGANSKEAILKVLQVALDH
jgi:uncharacterized UPF0160 family protein